ncbi:MAG: HhH-GPD-type base excision DNA repair protein [Acidimicrobiales bacterium]
MAKPVLPVTGNPDADRLLIEDPLALLLGMLLDQQVPMEWAFTGPHTLRQRLGHLDASQIAAMPVDDLVSVCQEKPAIHRFPKSMGERVHAVCEHLVEHYDGQADKIWKGVRNAQVLYDRLRELPGYGEEKTKIFIAILAKRFAKTPAGWEEVAAPFSDGVPRSVADISSEEALHEVRKWKKAQKAEGKSKQQ